MSSTARKKQPSCQPQLSSTYLSFRDPSDDVVEPSQAQRKRMRRVSHTNSLNRGRGAGRPGLVRCHSEGQLDQKGMDDPLPMSISRYMRALSGSWKNLLNCKWDDMMLSNSVIFYLEFCKLAWQVVKPFFSIKQKIYMCFISFLQISGDICIELFTHIILSLKRHWMWGTAKVINKTVEARNIQIARHISSGKRDCLEI